MTGRITRDDDPEALEALAQVVLSRVRPRTPDDDVVTYSDGTTARDECGTTYDHDWHVTYGDDGQLWQAICRQCGAEGEDDRSGGH